MCLNARDAFAASFNRLSQELGLGPELFQGGHDFSMVSQIFGGTNRGMFQYASKSTNRSIDQCNNIYLHGTEAEV